MLFKAWQAKFNAGLFQAVGVQIQAIPVQNLPTFGRQFKTAPDPGKPRSRFPKTAQVLFKCCQFLNKLRSTRVDLSPKSLHAQGAWSKPHRIQGKRCSRLPKTTPTLFKTFPENHSPLLFLAGARLAIC
jgi:hypothetical protein